MKKIFTRAAAFVVSLALSIGVVLTANEQVYPVSVADAGYYASITATGGQQLLGQLHDLMITTHVKYTTYDDCKDPAIALKTDAGSNGDIMEFYSQADLSSKWQYGANGTWNREHVWCQSLSSGLWGTSYGGSDLHHIRPTESSLNSARGNTKYGTANNGSAKYYKNSSGGTVALGGYLGGNAFEPIDEVKGDVARILMYVYVHYNKAVNVGGTTDGSLSSKSAVGTLKFTNIVYAVSEDAAIELLLRWNSLDPVDDIERNRNDAVYAVQGNRNPFIDNRQYAEAIWNSGEEEPVTSLEVTPSSLDLRVGLKSRLSAKALPESASQSVVWSSLDQTVATVSSDGVVTAKAAGQTFICATSAVTPAVQVKVPVTVTGGDEQTDKTVTVNLGSFALTDGYGFKTWTAGDLGGIAYIYGGSSAYPPKGLQFNKSKESYYFASNLPAPGGIASVTVKICEGESDREWKLLTSDTPYAEVQGKPTTGTDEGTKVVTEAGTTWFLDGTKQYFALTYELTQSKGACYIDSIIIEYATEVREDPEVPDDTNIEAFKAAVEDIAGADTITERYEAVTAAITAYRALSEAEREQCGEEVAALSDAIAQYNADIDSVGAVNRAAIDGALYGAAAITGLSGAIIVIVMSILN